MKKNVLLLGMMAFVGFTACKKKENVIPPVVNDTTTVNPQPALDTSITISGITDIHVDMYGFNSLPLTISRNSGLEEKVTLSITGMPQEIESEFAPSSGYASFTTRLETKAYFAKSGTYPVQITSTRESSGKTKTYNVNIVIDTPTKKECSVLFQTSVFNSWTTYEPMLDTNVATFTSLTNNTQENQLYFRNVILAWNDTTIGRYFSSPQTSSSFHVKVDFDCNTATLTVPKQTVRGRVLQGATNFRMFDIEGTGKVNKEDETYEIEYTTTYDDNGTPVTQKFVLIGQLRTL